MVVYAKDEEKDDRDIKRDAHMLISQSPGITSLSDLPLKFGVKCSLIFERQI